VSLARERLHALVDLVDHGGVHVDTDDLVALAGKLNRQREADLSQSDDRDAHEDLRL
jgi:hypothetical protein